MEELLTDSDKSKLLQIKAFFSDKSLEEYLNWYFDKQKKQNGVPYANIQLYFVYERGVCSDRVLRKHLSKMIKRKELIKFKDYNTTFYKKVRTNDKHQ